MNWQHFQTYNEAPTRAFESMCNQLFELWINKEYKNEKQSFVVVNGSGGDGGVESFATLTTGEEIGVQAKWFTDSINTSQFSNIKNSILTALKVHTNLKKYIVCVPRDLSNIKLGKNKKPITNTESSKWNNLVVAVKKEYPKVDIVLWGEHELQEMLQYAEAAGIRRYWFEKEELTTDVIKYSFEKQKDGWLDQRYIPILHNRGTIHKEMNCFLGDREEIVLLFGNLDNIIRTYELLLSDIDDLCELIAEKGITNTKDKELNELSDRAKKQLVQLFKAKHDFQYENKVSKWDEIVLSYDKIEAIHEWLKEKSYGENCQHFSRVKKRLIEISQFDMVGLFSKLMQRCNFEKLMILGNQGTGKTHGIVNEVEIQLENNFNIPILIQAKSASYQEEWRDILIRVLGLSQNWNEDELWSALEALSYRNEVNFPLHGMEDKNIRIVPKVIICVDGIDEIVPYDRWHERIRQVNTIVTRHKRIRFCFTGRPYAFGQNLIMSKDNAKKIVLAASGDVSVKSIYDNYIKHYNIDDAGVKWLRYSIRTPFSLKLLCECYQGKSIEKLGKSDVTVSKLLEKRFCKLDEEFKIWAGFRETNDQIVKSILLEINKLFENNTEITKTNLKKDLREMEIYHYIGEQGLEKILNFLEKYAFLQSYKRHTGDFFEINDTIYMSGTQPIYDYLKALYFYRNSKYSDDLEIDKKVLENIGALQMYSIMVLENYGKILWNNKSCQEHVYEEDLFGAIAFALVNVNVDVSSKHKDWLFDLMGRDAQILSNTVNKVILPLAREEKHPMGSLLLDECLMSYVKPAERDIIWSVPSGVKGDDDSQWVHYENIEYTKETYKLEDVDCFDGLPMIFAWGLTSVDNKQRTRLRKEITRWAILRPDEFFCLFVHFANVNDIQLKTDIYAIAMVVTYVCKKNHKYIKLMSGWIYHNIFQYNKIVNIHDAAIRYYSRAIMECAFSEKIITEKKINKCRPPYRTGNSLLAFAPEATKGTRMAGYKTLEYDLARYVLCDPLERKFLGNRNYKEAIQKMIEKYCRKYKLQNLSNEQFVLACAFGYIKEAGWNEEEFYGVPNGGKTGEKLGLDIAIGRDFGYATHGSMSSVMTITEKYTWSAKMELLGYLADRLPYYDSGDKYVEDYGILEDYVNPYQELCQIDVEKSMIEQNWILPDELALTIKECSYSREGIFEWIQKSDVPNFSKWINIKEGYTTLFASHEVSNEEQGVTTMMWISSGLISKGKIASLTASLRNKEFSMELLKVTDMVAYPESDCYISPLEVCWFDWKAEHESEIVYEKNVIFKNVATCVCNLHEQGEIHYKVPSKNLRNILGVSSGDGYHYYDENNIELLCHIDAGERYGDSQHLLLVNEDFFNTKILEAGFQPIWIVRVLKEPSIKAREKFDFFTEKDETYLVWKNSQRWRMRRIECND